MEKILNNYLEKSLKQLWNFLINSIYIMNNNVFKKILDILMISFIIHKKKKKINKIKKFLKSKSLNKTYKMKMFLL